MVLKSQLELNIPNVNATILPLFFWRNNFRGIFEIQYRLPNNVFQADAVVVLLKLVFLKIFATSKKS